MDAEDAAGEEDGSQVYPELITTVLAAYIPI